MYYSICMVVLAYKIVCWENCRSVRKSFPSNFYLCENICNEDLLCTISFHLKRHNSAPYPARYPCPCFGRATADFQRSTTNTHQRTKTGLKGSRQFHPRRFIPCKIIPSISSPTNSSQDQFIPGQIIPSQNIPLTISSPTISSPSKSSPAKISP